MSVAAKKWTIMAGEKWPAAWLRDGLLLRVQKPNPTVYSRRILGVAGRQLLVALRQLHDLPVARENCSSECDHQIMISEVLIEVKENLSETSPPHYS